MFVTSELRSARRRAAWACGRREGVEGLEVDGGDVDGVEGVAGVCLPALDILRRVVRFLVVQCEQGVVLVGEVWNEVCQ